MLLARSGLTGFWLTFSVFVLFSFVSSDSEARDEARKRHEDQGIPFFEVSFFFWVCP